MRELATSQDDTSGDDPSVMFSKQQDIFDSSVREVIEVGLIKVIPGIGLMFVHRHLIETREVPVFFRASQTNRDAFATRLPDVASRHLRKVAFDHLERVR